MTSRGEISDQVIWCHPQPGVVMELVVTLILLILAVLGTLLVMFQRRRRSGGVVGIGQNK
jgi:hypothetical protein